MPCPTEDVLSAFVEGRLPAEELALIEAHVDACRPCRGVLAAFGRTFASQSPEDTGGAVSRLQEAAALPPGAQVGRFVVLAWLGEGSSGAVYSAYDPDLDRKIALKLLHREAGRAPSGEGLKAEARALARVAHPNVVNVHEVGEVGEQVFLAMEFVDGITLRHWLRTPRTEAEILSVFIEAGQGLSAVHAAGLVHRDFKPENVLIGRDGRTRVTDFGLAKPPRRSEGAAGADGGGVATALAGTPAYMAPEQRAGRGADARSDQFSFCVSLYEAVAGARPGEEGLAQSAYVEPAARSAGAWPRSAAQRPPSVHGPPPRGAALGSR